MSEVSPTYSVSWRLQRTTTEFAFVSVPICDDLMREHSDGKWRIDVEKMVERAVEMAAAPGVTWHPENREIRMHPIQMAPPDLKEPSQDTSGRKRDGSEVSCLTESELH